MHGEHCRCVHHVLAKILVVLVWLSAIAFWVAVKRGLAWNMTPDEWFYQVVVFGILALSTLVCRCCCYKMMKGNHGGMSCPACEGKGGEHTHGHKEY